MSPLRFCCFLAANSLYPHNKKTKNWKTKKPKPKKPILGNSWKWLIFSPYIEKFLKIGFFFGFFGFGFFGFGFFGFSVFGFLLVLAVFGFPVFGISIALLQPLGVAEEPRHDLQQHISLNEIIMNY